MQKKSGIACFLREIMVLLQASYDKLYMQTSYICRQAIICYNKQVNFR